MGNAFGGSNKTTSTQQTSFDPSVMSAQQSLLAAAQGIAGPSLQNPPQYSIAGQNADQLKAGELARQSAMGAFNTDYSQQIANAGKGYSAAFTPTTGLGYTPTGISADAIRGFQNPFEDQVIGNTVNSMRREFTNNDARIGARNASTVAFGGSGAALERAQNARNYQDTLGSTVAGLRSAGFDRATGLAAQDAAIQNAAKQFGAGQTQQAYLSNQASDNAARAASASQGLQGAIAANSAYGSTFDRQQQAMQTLLGYGNQGQQQAQSILDLPKNNAAWVSGFIPGITGSTQTTQKTPTNPLSTIIGLAGLL